MVRLSLRQSLLAVVTCLTVLWSGISPSYGQGANISASFGQSVETELADSPEATLRRFLTGMLDGDADAIKAESLPNKELDVLLKSGERPPAEIVDQMKAAFQSLPIRRMKAGEQLTLPNGKKITIEEAMISDSRLQLSMVTMPVPVALVKVDGAWKVDPAPLIEARKAAKKTSEKKRR